MVICDCGKQKIVRGDHLRSGVTQSCGCYSSDIVKERFRRMRRLKESGQIQVKTKPLIDITNKKFNHLTAIEYVGGGKWLFECDCGARKIIHQYKVRSNKTKSCGNCGLQNRARVQDDITHKSWVYMISRCKNKREYKEKGIKVCDRWLGYNGFKNFVSDMGERPSVKHTIDRIDVYGNYEPNNCRWATQKEQCNNKSNNVYISHEGVTKTFSEWCDYYNLPYARCNNRYRKGLSFEEVFSKDKRTPFYTRDEVLAIRNFSLTKSQFEKKFNKYISQSMISRIKRKVAYYNIV